MRNKRKIKQTNAQKRTEERENGGREKELFVMKQISIGFHFTDFGL